MLVLGHAGITLGAAALVAGTLKSTHSPPIRRESWFILLGRYIDIRLLLVGSLLPDIIDKPAGLLFFRETFGSSRVFSHTLLFLIVITTVGFYLYRCRRSIWLLTLASGTLMHLILDEMWLAPHTLFWPLLGISFDKIYLMGWVSNIFQALISIPEVYIPEAVGLAILLWFGLVLLLKKRVGVFVKYGKAL